MIKIAVLAVENSPLSSLALPVDILNGAGVLYNRFAGIPEEPLFEVCVVAESSRQVECLRSVQVIADMVLDDLCAPDILIIGGLPEIGNIPAIYGPIREKLVALHKSGTVLASICTGAFMLASTGLLNGRMATTHWGLCKQFATQFPEVKVQTANTVIDEGSLLTSGGTTAGGDLALYLIRRYCGDVTADRCARVFLLDPYRSSQLPYEVPNIPIDHGDSDILKVQEWVDANFQRELYVKDLARIGSMNRRTFERKFKKATGCTPLAYLQKVRIEKAKRLLEDGEYSFETITSEVGYGDPSTFRRMFQKNTGLPPGVYRQRFCRNATPARSGSAVS